MREFWIYYLIGFFMTAIIEITSRICNSNGEPTPELEDKNPPVSVSNGTLFKAFVGIGILDWIFKGRRK